MVSSYRLAGSGGAVQRFQPRCVAGGVLARMLEAAGAVDGGAQLRAVVVSADEAPADLRSALFTEPDPPPAAIVWYFESDGSLRPDNALRPETGAIPTPIANWPSIRDTIVAGEAIGFAVAAAADAGLACTLAPVEGGRLKSALALPASTTVLAVLRVGYPHPVPGLVGQDDPVGHEN